MTTATLNKMEENTMKSVDALKASNLNSFEELEATLKQLPNLGEALARIEGKLDKIMEVLEALRESSSTK